MIYKAEERLEKSSKILNYLMEFIEREYGVIDDSDDPNIPYVTFKDSHHKFIYNTIEEATDLIRNVSHDFGIAKEWSKEELDKVNKLIDTDKLKQIKGEK